MSDLMTVKEVADYLKLNYMTVYKLAQKGRIPASKIGGNWRFKKELLDEWIAKQSTVVEGSVLVVDDDPGVREMLSDIISEQRYKVITVENGERAIEEMERQHFDLVFLDLVLPGMSGAEALAAIKQRDDKAIVAIITGYGDDPIAMEAMSLGPLLMIRKPFRVDDILEVVSIISSSARR
jgi:excisionase family DNA binding protein